MRHFLFLSCLFFFNLYYSQTLTLNIKKIPKSKGDLYIALFKSQEDFDAKKYYRTKIIFFKDLDKPIQFDNLEKGVYCVSLFYDLNNNKKLDKNLIGIPTEPYGLSNNPGFGFPDFEKMKFTFKGDLTISIEMR
jgi:uncharacterized protein (DUF2141 family)